MKKHKDFISLSDFNPAEISELLDLADQLKKIVKLANVSLY